MPKHSCNKEAEIAVISTDVKYIKEKIDYLLPEVQKNSEFRYKALGVIIGVGAVVGFIINAGFWLANKLWRE